MNKDIASILLPYLDYPDYFVIKEISDKWKSLVHLPCVWENTFYVHPYLRKKPSNYKAVHNYHDINNDDIQIMQHYPISGINFEFVNINKRILEVISKMPTLKYLYLAQSTVTDDDLKYFKDMKLNMIYVCFSQVTRKGRLYLRDIGIYEQCFCLPVLSDCHPDKFNWTKKDEERMKKN